MEVIISKPWEYELLKDENSNFIFSVECGTSATYTINIRLSENEVKEFEENNTIFLEVLAEQIRYSPSKFMGRNITLD